jgi:hypothetical protein
VHFEQCAIQKKFDRISTKSSPTTTKFHSGDHKVVGGLCSKDHLPKLGRTPGISDLAQERSFSPKNKIRSILHAHVDSSQFIQRAPQKLRSTRSNKNEKGILGERKNYKMGTKTQTQNLKPIGQEEVRASIPTKLSSLTRSGYTDGDLIHLWTSTTGD